MVLPLMFLAFGSIFWGFFSKDLFIGVGTPFFLTSLTTNFDNLVILEAEFAPTILKNIPFIFSKNQIQARYSAPKLSKIRDITCFFLNNDVSEFVS